MACDMFLTFNNGLKMPALGIGTWMAPDSEIEVALNEALIVGYRHIDTAPVYKNEKAIGAVLKQCLNSGKIRRDELFITTKLPPLALQPAAVEAALRNSLDDLQLDYVDLYLVHVPFGVFVENGDVKRKADGTVDFDPTTDHVAVWKKMEEMIELGLTKSIGLSNFNMRQIERVLKNCTIKPANLQIEYHVYLQQNILIEFCRKNDITVTAYAPLGSRGVAQLNKMCGVQRDLPDLIKIPLVKEIAAKYNKTPAQILIRWILDCGLATIPKSTNSQRLRENFNIFDFHLHELEIKQLKELDANLRICDFQFFHGIEKHPEFPF